MSDQIKLSSLPKDQARQLSEITKTRPQMEAISSRNLIKYLPWVSVQGGYYRVNRRQILEIRPGIVTFKSSEQEPQLFSPSLPQMPSLRKIDNEDLLKKIAEAAEKVEFEKGAQILTQGTEPTHINIIYSGKVSFYQDGVFGNNIENGSMGTGQYFGGFGLHYDQSGPEGDPEDVTKPEPIFMHQWMYSALASTKVVLLKLEYKKVLELIQGALAPGENASKYLLSRNEVMELAKMSNRKGEAAVQLFAGFHDNEPKIPSAYVAYDPNPR